MKRTVQKLNQQTQLHSVIFQLSAKNTANSDPCDGFEIPENPTVFQLGKKEFDVYSDAEKSE